MTAAHTSALRDYVSRSPVVPVVTINDARISIDLAQAMVESGLFVIEVTLRTPAALDAINAIAKAVPDAIVAAGTILHASQIGEVADAGAKFIVTPGTPPKLAEALSLSPIPVMPGCATVSEAMTLSSLGFQILKFFPAAASGGTAWLKGIQGPLPQLSFCPTGGIDVANAASYLALPNVACVGGTWVAPADALKSGDMAAVRRLASQAAGLRAQT
ncbi:bifunctional 4-hydroxy-2-oxoglutarate aldolase/2-dehydro-3-deoxy-phosphogluconate aldolase [Microvirga sp. 2YAF29]|uniref:bifunctional 4-hydroxy-2-oxoglutarate aldolase/2-dehydro-3-deoxy-phosphogluconate aldolase n=1 Tax=Microvirga sp. 2YAF29 TaxID=3233031 RepID=UPI003F990C7B